MGIHFSEDYLNEIKDRNTLFDVINDYVTLKYIGDGYQSICPFPDHNEKTASFHYFSEDRGVHCFGCNCKIGDVIDFVQKVENLNFPDAIMFLAQRAGMEIPKEGLGKKEKAREDAHILLKNKSRKFWSLLTNENPEAMKYLVEDRGLTKEEINKYRIGFCDYSEKDNSQFKKLCNRIIFTILNHRGRTVGFSGRQLPENEDDKYPKFINSSDKDNILFKKKEIIYGLNYAKKSIRQKGYAVIVEGYMDVIMLHRYGLENTVACMGTALTEEQIYRIKTLTDRVILFLDGDKSGQKATKRSIKLLKENNLDVKVIKGLDGKDPAEMALEFKEGMKPWIINNAKSIEQYYMEGFLTIYDNKIFNAKKELIKQIEESFIDKINDIDVELALGPVCDRLNLTMAALKKETGQ